MLFAGWGWKEGWGALGRSKIGPLGCWDPQGSDKGLWEERDQQIRGAEGLGVASLDFAGVGLPRQAPGHSCSNSQAEGWVTEGASQGRREACDNRLLACPASALPPPTFPRAPSSSSKEGSGHSTPTHSSFLTEVLVT